MLGEIKSLMITRYWEKTIWRRGNEYLKGNLYEKPLFIIEFAQGNVNAANGADAVGCDC